MRERLDTLKFKSDLVFEPTQRLFVFTIVIKIVIIIIIIITAINISVITIAHMIITFLFSVTCLMTLQ